MKIVCDSCATKYSISDDKVRGKVFKIRCKKCSHIIVVRGTNDAASAAPAAAADGGGWHLVVDGEQVGPLPEAEIRARLARNEINGETYIWKEGLTDWLKLSTVPEFADAVSAPPAGEASGAVAVSNDLFTDSVAMGGAASPMTVQVDDGLIQASTPAARVGGGGLFGAVDAAANGSAGRAAVRASAGAGAAEEHDVFGAPAASRGGDLFASHAAAQPVASDDGRRGGAANHDGGRVENLTAQRHENSVLFSLANLQQLAMPTAAAKPLSTTSNGSSAQSEGSGLIDIRAMAATTMGAPSEARGGGGGSLGDDLPTFGSFSAAAPVLLPMPSQSGPPKWLYAVIGGMAILLIGIAFMAYKLFTTKPVIEQVQVPAPAPVPVAPASPTKVAAAPAAPAATPPTTIPDDKLPPREGAPDPAVVAAADAAKAKAAAARKAGKAGGKERKGLAGAETGAGKTVAAAPAAEPEAPPKKAGPAKGSLDDLLEGALSGKQRARTRAPSADDDSPGPARKGGAGAAAEPSAAGPLAKSAVVAGMNGIKGKINECYQQFKVPGMAMVNVVIAKNGKVGTATVSGKFAGTPTGVCVEKAVKSASFPPSEGLTTPYPFQLK